MQELSIAYQNKWKSDATLAAIGTPFFSQQPEGTPRPYARFSFVPGRGNVHVMGLKDYIENVKIQTDIFSGSYLDALAKIEQVCRIFDYASLSMPNDVCLSVIRNDPPRCSMKYDNDNNELYHALCVHEFRVQRSTN